MNLEPYFIGWKVNKLSANVASVRYRALLPILALVSPRVSNRIFASAVSSNLDGIGTLVIVKSFTADDLCLAQQAFHKGIRIVFDLCDNIFIENYGSKAGNNSLMNMFTAIAAFVDTFVVTTEPLADIVRQRVPNASVVVIPDPIETPHLRADMDRLLKAASTPKAIERLKSFAKKVSNEIVAFEKRNRIRSIYKKLSKIMSRLRKDGVSKARKSVKRLLKRCYSIIRTAAKICIYGLAGQQKKLQKPQKTPPAAQHAHCITWFGNHGAEYARFGMLDLLEIRGALEAISQEFDVELVVISNNRAKYDEHIRPLCIPSRYVEWSPHEVESWLNRSHVVVLPNTLDAFSICKSANRTVLAVSHGVPVVATSTPALAPLASHVHLGDTLQGLRRYLNDPEKGRADARAAYALAQTLFGQEATAAAWMSVLLQPRKVNALDTPAQCIVVLNLIQDLDLALPVIDVWLSNQFTVQVWCSASLIKKSPRVLASLQARQLSYRVLSDDLPSDSFGLPVGAKHMLTVTETNLGPHRFARTLTEWALSQGLRVATLQHGFENVGLTHDDSVHSIDKVTIKAQRIYIWGGLETLHPRLDEGVRARCVPVGCPKPATVAPAGLGSLLPVDRPVVGIFENLHWHRYDDAYRTNFLDAVNFLADRFPEITFLVKPHHAGMWLTHRHTGNRPTAANIVIADPKISSWESYTASSLLGHMTAVITSPSTVALDAARQGLPVAVFAGELDLPNYKPLLLLREQADWLNFLSSALNHGQRGELTGISADFVSRVIIKQDGARRIALDISTSS